MAGSGLAVKTKTVKDFLATEQVQKEFKAALPKELSMEKFLRVAITTITQNPKLLDCTMQSIMKGLIQSAQLGLVVDGYLGQAYLIPYGKEAKFQVGYKGLIALALRSGKVKGFSVQVVYENDKFECAFGLNEKLEHIPAVKDRGEMIAAYSIARMAGGETSFDVMFAEDIARARAVSKSASRSDSVWNIHTGEMWRKTVVIRHSKYLPLSPDFQQAAAITEGNDIGLGDAISAGPTTEEVTNRFDDEPEVTNVKTVEDETPKKGTPKAEAIPKDEPPKDEAPTGPTCDELLSEINKLNSKEEITQWEHDRSGVIINFTDDQKAMVKDITRMRKAEIEEMGEAKKD